jgi:hypothetical protein
MRACVGEWLHPRLSDADWEDKGKGSDEAMLIHGAFPFNPAHLPCLEPGRECRHLVRGVEQLTERALLALQVARLGQKKQVAGVIALQSRAHLGGKYREGGGKARLGQQKGPTVLFRSYGFTSLGRSGREAGVSERCQYEEWKCPRFCVCV